MAGEIDGTSKGLLGAFAIFTLGSGIASLVYGAFLLVRYMGIEFNFGLFSLYATSIVLIVIGGLLIITVILGVIGALRGVANLRMATLVLLFLLFAALAVIGVWSMVSFKTGQLQRSIDLDIKNLNDHSGNMTDYLTRKKAYLTDHSNCCGTYSTDDAKANPEGIPESCCITPGCSRNTVSNAANTFKESCASVYFRTKSGAVFNLSILSLAAAGAVLLGLIFYVVVSQRARAGYAAVSRG